jgi:hypothetical protein
MLLKIRENHDKMNDYQIRISLSSRTVTQKPVFALLHTEHSELTRGVISITGMTQEAG